MIQAKKSINSFQVKLHGIASMWEADNIVFGINSFQVKLHFLGKEFLVSEKVASYQFLSGKAPLNLSRKSKHAEKVSIPFR